MNYAQLAVQDGIWRLEKNDGYAMGILGMFLASDVTWDGAPYFKEWLLNNDLHYLEGNFCLLSKKDDLVTMNCKYAINFNKGAGKFPLHALADLLSLWQKLCDSDLLPSGNTVITYKKNVFHVGNSSGNSLIF
jgi:hypothetical protein